MSARKVDGVRADTAMDASDPVSEPVLFLSHAGADTEAALDLALRLERTPAAQEAGLQVWIDDRDLLFGRAWQQQLEDVIEKRSSAFAVLIGTRGVVNWVDSELRVALSRARKDSDYPLIPILIGNARSADLPGFARQYHAIKAPSATDPALLVNLLAAVLRPDRREPIAIVDRPFVGLASFGQETAELFHGRGGETKELVERLRRTNLLMIVGDSGSGKSSLARAGVLPRFRGGGFSGQSGGQPGRTFRRVIEMRPQGQPFERLVDAIKDAALKAGIDAQTRGVLAEWVRSRDPAK